MGRSWGRFEHTKFPLAEYASEHYGEHVCLAGGDRRDPLRSLLKAFFDFNNVGFQTLRSIWQIPWRDLSFGRRKEGMFFDKWQGGMPFNRWKGDSSYPLYYTCKHGFYETTKSLLEETTNSRSFTSTVRIGGECLAAAAGGGHLKVVRLLLDHGVDVEATGGTALQGAASGGYLKIIRLLLENGADVNVGEGSVLQEAASYGRLEIVRLMVENGADINGKGGYCKSPLQEAASGGHLEVVEFLLDHGADLEVKEGQVVSAFHMAAFGGHLEVIKVLLENGSDVKVQGRTALPAAASRGHLKVVRLLLENGADVNAGGGYCGTAVQEAASGGHLEVVKLLLDHRANVNAEEGYGRPAVQEAAFGGHLEVVKLLLEHGADVEADRGYGASALQQAASSGCTKAVFKLLQHDADVNVNTNLQRARHMEIAELLTKHYAGRTTAHHTTSADDTLVGLLLEKAEQGISVNQAEIQPFAVESEDGVDATLKMDVLDLYVMPKSASKKTIMPLKDKDLDADVRKRARVSTVVEKPNKRRKTGKIEIFTLDPQLTSWYSGSTRAIKVKSAEEEDEHQAEELQTSEAKSSAVSEGREDEEKPQETPETGSSKGKEREMDVESDEGKWVP